MLVIVYSADLFFVHPIFNSALSPSKRVMSPISLPLRYEAIWCSSIGYIQCTLNLETGLFTLKMSLNCILSLNILIFCSKLKNGLLQKKNTKWQFVMSPKLYVCISRLHCTLLSIYDDDKLQI